MIHPKPSTDRVKPTGVPSRPEMGYLHLSFEYHKGTFKVRVWQISDLLLPPPQISMIHSIFVRAYFIPDKARKTVRRTEEILLDIPEPGGEETPKTGIQHIFTPSSFKFRTPLQYRGVTEDMVKERGLQLEVCMTQRRSRRTFLMAMVHMPLQTAVRRPIREKYPLIPCMNITIPNNMRVYSAAQLQVESSKGRHSPVIQRVASPHADVVPVTARDVELEDVVSLSGEDFLRSHLSLCMDEDSDSDSGEGGGGGRLQAVHVSNGAGSGGSSTTTLNMPSSGDEILDNSDDDGVPVVTVQSDISTRNTQIDMSFAENSVMPTAKKKIIPNELLDMSDDVTLEMPSEDTVVNMDSPDDMEHSPGLPSSENVTRKTKPGLTAETCHRKARTASQGKKIHKDGERGQVVQGSPIMATPRKKKIAILPGEINIPSGELNNISVSELRPSPNTSTDSEGLSPARLPSTSPLQDSAFSPASRPETPCWDFYDWGEDLQAEEGLELSSKTLEDGLAQLRSDGIGSLQNLTSEPILPMDLADGFDSLTVDTVQTEPAE